LATRECKICSSSFEGRSDRNWCTLDCKKKLKSLYDKVYHLDNRDRKIRTSCEWQESNKLRKQTYDKVRRETLPKRDRSYEKYDPESGRLRAAKRRATKRNQGSYTVSKIDLSRALHRSRHRCYYCSTAFTEDNPLEWDHTVPISRGGTHSIGNLNPTCRRCNRNKQSKLVVEWRFGKIVPNNQYTNR
jgi:hypothetical protein